jgi:hypothetical protein
VVIDGAREAIDESMAEQDLHVRSLVYCLNTSEGLIFADPPSLDFETESFCGTGTRTNRRGESG